MGIEKEGAKFRTGLEPVETQAKIVQWTILLTRVRVVPLPAPNKNVEIKKGWIIIYQLYVACLFFELLVLGPQQFPIGHQDLAYFVL